MLSQQDITSTDKEQNQNGSIPHGLDLRSALDQLNGIRESAKTFTQLSSDVSNVLCAIPVVIEVFYLELKSGPQQELDFSLLRSGSGEVAKNVEQWAANAGINCCTTGQPRLEVSEDAASGSAFQMLAVPVSGRTSGAALIAMLHGDDDKNNKLILLESAARCLSQWQSNQHLAIATEAAEDLAALDQLVATVEDALSLDSACHLTAKALSKHLQTLQSLSHSAATQADTAVNVYIGLTKDGKPLELAAVSDANTLPVGDQRESIEAAMQESLCRGSASKWHRGEDNQAGVLCLKRMSNVVNKSHIVACPIHCDQLNSGAIGVIVFGSQQPLSSRSFAFVDSCAARMGSALQLVKRAEPGRLQGLMDKLKGIWASRKKLALIGVLGLAISMIPLPYHVGSECEVRPESKLYIASPFDTTLEKCFVEPGQQVTQDMVLATLDGREARMELAEIEADLNRAVKQRDGHVVSHESGEAYVAKYEIKRLESRRDLLLHRQQSLELRTPQDGIVIAGDLKKSEGMPLSIGEPLFEVAMLNKLRVELSIPEDDVRYTQPNMTTTIRLDAFPFKSWEGTIERIHPASELRNDQNVFIAIVQIDNADGRLRPGMTGYANTKTVWRPVIWNYLHKPAAATARWLGW